MSTAPAAAEGTTSPAEGTPAFDWGADDAGGDLATEEPAKPAEPADEAAADGAEDEEEAAAVEAEDAAAAKPSKLSTARAELAKKESAFRAEQAAHRAEAEKLKKERADFDVGKGSGDSLRKAARGDLAKFVSELGLSPEAAMEQAKSLWWSLQPEDKRPAGFGAQAKTRTELDDVKATAAKAAKDLEDYKASVEAKEKQRAEQAQLNEFFGATHGEFGKLALPFANSLAKADAGELNNEIQKAFLALEDEGVTPEQITPDKLGAAVEAALSKRYAWLRDVFAPKTETTQEPKDKKAPTTALSTKKVAGGGPTTKAPQTDKERFDAALKELGD